jgi:tetratricopeptide (TPR) repeat protein
MDPKKIESYTVGSYFMRLHLNRPREAEAFLREGLRNNPGSYEILFELGRLYHENYHDADRARSVWQLALNRWYKDPEALKDNKLAFEEITVHLAQLEREAGNWQQAINWFQAAQNVSPDRNALQQRIDEIKKNMAAQTNAPAAAPQQP